MASLAIARARDGLALALIVVTVGGAVYTGLGTSNYYQFYPALMKLQVNLVNLQWNSTQKPISLNGTATFTMANPTSFHGLLMRVFQPSLTIENDTYTVAQGQTMSAAGSRRSDQGSLEPGKALNLAIQFQGALDSPQLVATTVKNGGKVVFIFSIVVDLNSFLDNVAQVKAYYECTGTTGSGTCTQTNVLVVPGHQPFGTPGGGGGGA